MSIPLFSFDPGSQNQRVSGYVVGGEENAPQRYSAYNFQTQQGMDLLIYAAYRQVFNEQQMVSHNYQPFLESQLRSRQITVREFIRGLVMSSVFREWVYDCNDNYRFVQLCIQRLLGRDVYNEREKMAWSIVLATQGISGLVDELLDSEEYLENFGDDTVPYQRRRILPQRSQGELPFARMARYSKAYRDQLGALAGVSGPLKIWQFPKAPLSPLLYVGGSLVVFSFLYLIYIGRTLAG